jgi:hypothetical protein
VGFQRCDISSIPKRKKSDRLGLSGSSQATGVSFELAGEERPTQLLCKVVRVGAKLSEKKKARKNIRAEVRLEMRKVSCSRWSKDNLTRW